MVDICSNEAGLGRVQLFFFTFSWGLFFLKISHRDSKCHSLPDHSYVSYVSYADTRVGLSLLKKQKTKQRPVLLHPLDHTWHLTETTAASQEKTLTLKTGVAECFTTETFVILHPVDNNRSAEYVCKNKNVRLLQAGSWLWGEKTHNIREKKDFLCQDTSENSPHEKQTNAELSHPSAITTRPDAWSMKSPREAPMTTTMHFLKTWLMGKKTSSTWSTFHTYF